jgi:hypothetical protein
MMSIAGHLSAKMLAHDSPVRFEAKRTALHALSTGRLAKPRPRVSRHPTIELLSWEVLMSERAFTIPEIVLIAGTRVALGAGLGLLIAGKLSRDARRGAGWALLAVGALTSIPLVVAVVRKPRLAGIQAA